MRRAPVLGLAIAVSVALGGCSMSNGDSTETKSEEEVAQRINALPDVSEATVEYEQTMDGLSKHYAIAVEITASEAGTSEAKVAELVDEVLPLAWSVRGKAPDRGVILRIRTNPQLAIGPIAAAAGWKDVGYPKNPELLAKLPYQASFGKQALDDQIGPWPVDAD